MRSRWEAVFCLRFMPQACIIQPNDCASCDQTMEKVAVDITAGEHRNRDFPLDVDPAREQGRKRDRATRLDYELELPKRKRDRARDFLVAGANALAHQRAIDCKGELAGRARHQGIANGPGRRRIALALPAAKRARMVIEV